MSDLKTGGLVRPEVLSLPMDQETPGVISLPMQISHPRTVGCLFPDGHTYLAAIQANTLPEFSKKKSTNSLSNGKEQSSIKIFNATDCVEQKKNSTNSRTRIQPPKDVVKLEDRLHYLLQPPLETLLSSDSLRFPFKPFSYQLEGVAYLFPRREAVLADEMGLGKTMQAITTIRLLAKMGEIRRVLLVCPKPVVTNWQREFALWAPELPIAIVSGNKAQRNLRWKGVEPGVTIANFELVVRDLESIEAGPYPYDLMILDEAQRIKNDSGATNKAICQVPRKRSWALTGTPIENSTDDLVGIFNFVSPKLLYKGMRPRVITKAISDHVLRRTKDDVQLDLPPKLIRDAAVTLTPEQQDTYQFAEDEGIVRLNEMGAELTIQHVFQLVLRLKQICNFDPVSGASAKLDLLEEDLEECAASGRKAIIFSQWVKTIDKLQKKLSRFNPEAYHGKIPSNKRDAVLQRFKNDPNCHVILMSYGAGSVGLNLQFAGYVFLFDRWWNPAVEDQAINRAHRIGTSGPVTVTRFLTVNTIEERIDQILSAKRELFDTIFGSQWQGGKYGMSKKEVMGLLGLKGTAGSKPVAA